LFKYFRQLFYLFDRKLFEYIEKIDMKDFLNKKDFGNWGEHIAADYLKGQGYQLVERNFRCPYGEIDLIAKEKNIWCFIEVKTRKGCSFGYGYDSVTRMKQKHIGKVAQYYLNKAALYEAPARFDVVSIDFISANDYQIQLIRNAFYMSSDERG
jgi:putative endonuclease